MRASSARAFETMGRLAGALLAAAGLALGVGMRGATADEPPDPPTLETVEAPAPTSLSFRWSDLKEPADSFRVNVYRDGKNVHGQFNPNIPESGASTIEQYQRTWP